MNFWKVSLFLFLCKCKFAHLAHKRPGRSLFDELPLNGALTTTTTRPLVRRSATGFSDIHNQNGIGVFISLPNFPGRSETEKEEYENSQPFLPSNESDDGGHSHSQEEIHSEGVVEITPLKSESSRTKSSIHSISIENDSRIGHYFQTIGQRHQEKPKVTHNTRFLSQSHFHSSAPQSPSSPTPKRAQGDQYRHHTTIAFQTIPITRQVTEFVRVPNIVHHITSSSTTTNSAAVEPAIKQSQDYAETPFIIREHYLKKKQHQHHQQTQLRSEAVDNNNDNNRLKGHLTFSSSFGLGNDNTPSNRLRQTIKNIPGPELFNLLHVINNRTPSAPRAQPVAPLIIRSPGSFSSPINFDHSQVLKEIVREQRYQLTLNDLNSRLREEKRITERARSDYKGLFSKGALLLSALTLLPAVVNPITTTTTVAAAAGASAASLPSYLLPAIHSAVG